MLAVCACSLLFTITATIYPPPSSFFFLLSSCSLFPSFFCFYFFSSHLTLLKLRLFPTAIKCCLHHGRPSPSPPPKKSGFLGEQRRLKQEKCFGKFVLNQLPLQLFQSLAKARRRFAISQDQSKEPALVLPEKGKGTLAGGKAASEPKSFSLARQLCSQHVQASKRHWERRTSHIPRSLPEASTILKGSHFITATLKMALAFGLETPRDKALIPNVSELPDGSLC